jgi:ABC-type branched-subunit amino acid transport system ATPase component
MSVETTWLNAIEAAAAESWLTPAQRRASDAILTRFGVHPFVALIGPRGSGKTFIARLLARERGYTLVCRLDEAPAGTRQVILDGDPYTRELREVRMRLGLGRVIVLQTRPPADPMPVIEVTLTLTDVRHFQATLTKAGILRAFTRDDVSTDLAALLRQEALAQGDAHVAR